MTSSEYYQKMTSLTTTIGHTMIDEKVAMGALDVRFISSRDQLANGITKSVTKSMLQSLRHNLNLVTVKIEGECTRIYKR